MAPPNQPRDDSAVRLDGDLQAAGLRYGPALRRYFQKRVPTSEADDLVQDVFVKMQARAAPSEVENIEGYLFRIAATVLIDHHRREGRIWARRDPIEDSLDLIEGISPERALIAKQTLDLVVTAMQGLPPRTGEAFVLHRFEEMSYAAIGKKMGISARTVENLVARAVKRLMECARARP